MSGAIAAIAPKLGKLIPRLASDHDGELIATISAIRRTLDAAGLDLHDLAETISAPADRPRVEQPTDSDFPSMFSVIWRFNPPGPEWSDILESIRAHYQARGRLSFKQASLVRRFYRTAMANRDARGEE